MRFTRLEPLFGEDGLKKLSQATVAVVGLGGVGGIAAEVLARSGVGNLIICDFDEIEESNINRQIVASTNTIGQNKANVLGQMIKEINPDCKLTIINRPYYNFIKDLNVDYLLDAIDHLEDKITLIKDALACNIVFVSSMGAAKKLDPSLVKLTTLAKTTYDPLARLLRSEFRGEHITVVSSTEEKSAMLTTLASYMPVVATFGIIGADYIIKEILRRPK